MTFTSCCMGGRFFLWWWLSKYFCSIYAVLCNRGIHDVWFVGYMIVDLVKHEVRSVLLSQRLKPKLLPTSCSKLQKSHQADTNHGTLEISGILIFMNSCFHYAVSRYLSVSHHSKSNQRPSTTFEKEVEWYKNIIHDFLQGMLCARETYKTISYPNDLRYWCLQEWAI